jgi:hypothetical protein
VRKLISIVLPLLVLAALLPGMGLAQSSDGQPVPFITGGGQPDTPAGIQDVLFEQVAYGGGAWASQCFPDLGWCYYTADDFINEEPWSIDSVFVPGQGAIENADLFNWVIYPDAGGMPDGYPGDGNDLWTVSIPTTTPGVTISDGDVTVDFNLAIGGPMEIPAGHWWLIFFPTMSLNPYGQWFWEAGQPNQYHPGVQHIVSPPWVPQSVGYAFRLEGTAGGEPVVFATHVRIVNLPGAGLLLGIVRIVDEGLTPVPGATVDVEWTLPIGGGYVVPQTRTTNANGLAFPLMLGHWSGTYVLDLTNMTAAGYVYDPNMNYESSATITLP